MQAAAGSALIGTGVALNDYVKSPVRRALVYGALVLGGTGVIAFSEDATGKKYIFGEDSTLVFDQIRQDIGDLGITPGPDSDAQYINERGPLITWLLLAVFALAFVTLVYASVRVDLAVMKKLAGFFEKRGKKHPFSWTGMVYAAAVYAIFELDNLKK